MTILRRGNKGEEVARLQALLCLADFNAKPIDGDFGPGTECMVRACQASKALPATGQADTDTQDALDMNQPDMTKIPVLVIDTLVVVAPPQLTKEFTNDPVDAGGTVTLQFTLTNQDTGNAASSVAFTDNLSTALSGLTATSVGTNTCSFTVGGLGTGMLSLSNGSVGAGGTCTLSVTLTLPGTVPGTSFVNTTSSLTGMIGGLSVTGDPASDTLLVNTLTFTKSFSGDLRAGGTQTLTFTITNLDTSSGIGDLSFSDSLAGVVSGLIAVAPLPTNPCGSSSTLAGTSFLTFMGGNLAASGMCSFPVTVTVPANTAAGSFTNTTSDLFQFGISKAVPASVALNVVTEADVSVTKSDGVTSATPGQSLTYTIVASNAGPSDAPAVTLTDTFSAALGCSWTSVASGGTTGNTASMGNLSDTLNLPVGSFVTYTVTCMIASSATGTLSNTATVASSVTDPTPGNNSANHTTPLAGLQADLSISKDDGVTAIVPGTTLTYTLTITNNGPSNSTGGTVTDVLPVGLTFVSSVFGCTEAGGTVTCPFGALPVGNSVALTFMVMVGSGLPGTITNTATVTGNETDPDGGNSSASHMTPLLPAFSMAFAPNPIPVGGTSTLTFTIDNTGGAAAANNLAFPATFPGAVTVAAQTVGAQTKTAAAQPPAVVAAPLTVSTTCMGGTITTMAGATTISYSGGTVAAGASCTVQVLVTSSTPGSHLITSGDLTSSLGNSGPANATLTVTLLQPNSITVIKEASAEDLMASFFFTTTGAGLSDFSLVDDGSGANTRTFSDLSLGTFTITEMVPAGWKLDTLVCTSGGTGTSVAADKDTGQATITLAAGGGVGCTFFNVLGIPTLPQWGLLLLTLSLLTLATWQLIGQPARIGRASTDAAVLVPVSSHWPSSLLLGQGLAAVGLLIYALFNPLVPHDGVGVLLAGLLIGVMIELYRRSE